MNHSDGDLAAHYYSLHDLQIDKFFLSFLSHELYVVNTHTTAFEKINDQN